MSDEGAPWRTDDDRVARAVWSRIAEPGDVAAHAWVDDLGAVEALRRIGEARAAGSAPPEAMRWRVRLPDAEPTRDLATLARFGGRLLVPGDGEWPTGLEDLWREQPFCLWVRGPLRLDEVCATAAALVGCRASSAYGDHVAGELASGCADRGIAVVSGAAYGIDGAAHRGALVAEGATVAVLACGVDRVYPRGHERLIERIAHAGLIVSEVAPGSAPTRWRFLERNRLIAALSGVTVVVEAAHRSGALGTAQRAGRIGRVLAAVPGPVTSPTSAGCHQLLRDGAVCVTDAAEVAELLAPIGDPLVPPLGVAAVHDDLSTADLHVLDALPLRRGAPVESLTKVAGLDPAGVRAGLGRLEVRGLALRDGSGWRRAPGR